MRWKDVLLFLRIVRDSLVWPVEIPYNLFLKTTDLGKLWIQRYEYPLHWYIAEVVLFIIGIAGGIRSIYDLVLFITAYLAGVVVRVIMRYMPKPDKAYFTVTLVIMTFICGLFYASFFKVIYGIVSYLATFL